MLTENGNTVISQKPETNAEDYEWLRKTGLNYIQQFSGSMWTDYNLHDPGITILELLCYSLTDLAYRNSFPVADLLTSEGEKSPDKNDFFTARKILTSHPITVRDYRKLTLDRIPAVRNVWLETLDNVAYDPVVYFDKKNALTTLVKPDGSYDILQLKGLYVVKLDIEDFETARGRHPHFLRTLAHYRDKDSPFTGEEADISEYETCITNYAKSILYSSRNACEDFEIIRIADREFVAVCADIELKGDANADEVFRNINELLYTYINPSIRFYSFKELIEKGKRTEEIFNGPGAIRGFLDDDDLDKHGHKEVLYVSDMINLLLQNIKGILQIKSIHLSSYRKNEDGTFTIIENAQPYCLHLKDKENSVFQFMLDAGEQDPKKVFNHIRFSKGAIYFSPRRQVEYQHYRFIDFPDMPDDFQNDLPFPSGRNRNLLNYYSVQNDFPLCYYTGIDGIANGETNLRKAQRLQTKAYLLFFDQLLANYLSQLNSLKNVFSYRRGVNVSTNEPLALDEKMIKDLRKLLFSKHKPEENISDEDYFKSTYKQYSTTLETTKQSHSRRNRLLDHLLSRFNELFVDYSIFKFQQNSQGDFFNQSATFETINDKIQFLKLYPIISGKRSHAFNYTRGLYAADNISGVQLRIQKMMGLASSRNRSLVTAVNDIDYQVLLQNLITKEKPLPEEKLVVEDNRFTSFDQSFDIHILEHILLRPLYKSSTDLLTSLLPLCGDGSNNQHAACLIPDNYSMQLTVVAPGWLSISSNMDFRAFTENLIRTEAPAHVAIRICWIDPARMFLFEKTTEKFFAEMRNVKAVGGNPKDGDLKNFNKALQDVYLMVGALKNMYPLSNLNECQQINYNADVDKMKSPFILNHSALGSEEDEEWFAFEKKEGIVAKAAPKEGPADLKPPRKVAMPVKKTSAPAKKSMIKKQPKKKNK